MRAFAFFLTALCVAALSLSCSSPFDLESKDRAEPLARTSIGADVLGWESHTAMPVPVRAAAAATDGSRIYVLGGARGFADCSVLNQIYDPATDTWSSGASFAGPGLGNPLANAMSDGIHLLGGAACAPPAFTRHEVYDPATEAWSDRAPPFVSIGTIGILNRLEGSLRRPRCGWLGSQSSFGKAREDGRFLLK
ncbi:MAG: hypothetical protein JSW46_07360 [Gemmatimonadota bacterium]|nr:MAG: hypothetical protein JSW46_07360 [Gemmatimonadota bacterium]